MKDDDKGLDTRGDSDNEYDEDNALVKFPKVSIVTGDAIDLAMTSPRVDCTYEGVTHSSGSTFPCINGCMCECFEGEVEMECIE